uniref:Protein PAT1 homolog 1 n=1 Tax=Cacopsylla melanoneura TaxID=428564 RepID=A0A8D8YGD2_9HEMI
MDSLEVEFAGGDEIEENSEYDALNDETFGNAEDPGDDDWEEEHEKFAIIEESFKKFSTTPCEETNNGVHVDRLERPKLKSLEEIEQELLNKHAQEREQHNMLYNRPQQPLGQLPRPTAIHKQRPVVRVPRPGDPLPVPLVAQDMDPASLLAALGIHPIPPVKPYDAQIPPPEIKPQAAVSLNNQPQILQNRQPQVSMNHQPQVPMNHPPQASPGLGRAPPSSHPYVVPVLQQEDQQLNPLPSSDQEMDEDYDPYAGLMNQRERRWLANIQVMQLEGDDPDYDFYFTEYQKRHGLQHRNSNSDKYNGMHNNNVSESPKMSYVPLQFENSLGKVQVGSVQAPRKVIDRELVSNGTVSPDRGLKAKPRKKLKHILLELEYLYASLQRMDSLSSVSSATETPGLRILQRRPAQPPPLEVGASTTELNDYPSDPATLMSYFLKDRDHFLAYMSIRKGKVLGYRLLRLRQDDRFWLMLFQDFHLLVTRDEAEEILLTYLPILRSWLQTRGSWELLSCILPMLLEEDTPDFALTNKFGMSLIASIIVTAEGLYNSNSPINKEQHELYVKFIITLVDKAFQYKTELERPVMGIDTKTLDSNFFRIESHFYRVHQRMDATKKAIIFNALALPTYQKKKNKMKN